MQEYTLEKFNREIKIIDIDVTEVNESWGVKILFIINGNKKRAIITNSESPN